MVASIDMKPRRDSILKVFLQSQFSAKAPSLPESLNLSGQVSIVTGASTGLGFQCGRQLLALKLSHLVLAVRSLQKGEAAAAKFRAEFSQAKIEVWPLEMTSYESIQAFARKVDRDLPRLDIVILNAGMVSPHFSIVSGTGHEQIIQINYLSTFLLAILLLPILKVKSPPSKPGRLTIVNSGAALAAKFPNHDSSHLLASFDTTATMPWDPIERYNVSKLLGHLVMVTLKDCVNANDVIVNLVDPGYCKGTGLHREAKGFLGFALSASKRLTGRTLEHGASTYIDAALVKGEESHGCFVMDWEVRP